MKILPVLVSALALASLGGGCRSEDDGTARGTLGEGAAFAPAEVVVLADTQADDDGKEVPRARIVASTKGGLCARMDNAVMIDPDEVAVSLWVDAAKFTVAKTTVSPDTATVEKKAGASLLDAKVMCGKAEFPGPDRGT